MNLPLLLQVSLTFCEKNKQFEENFIDMGLLSHEDLKEAIELVNDPDFISILNKSMNNTKQLEKMNGGVILTSAAGSAPKEVTPPGVGYQMCKSFGSMSILNAKCATECNAELRISCVRVTKENKECYGNCKGSITCMEGCTFYSSCYEDTFRMNQCYGIGLPKKESFACSTCPVRNKCRAEVRKKEVTR